MPELFIKISLIVHVTAGTAALASGLMAMLLRRQTPRHKRAGKIYFWCMTVVFITGFYLSLLRGNLFLFYISIFSYYLTLVAYRALKYKQPKPVQKMDWIIEIIAGLTFIGLIAYALIVFLSPGDRLTGIIPLAFGFFGLMGVRRNLQQFKNGPKERLAWMKIHISNMMGSYIAAITAFLVNQAEYIPLPQVVLWLGPTIALVPLIRSEIRKVRTIPINS